MAAQPTYRKKLIEVDLPLDEINAESAREKSIRHGHPSTLHLWWARRPLAACRAVIFASLVDDPGECEDEFPTKSEQDEERERLHDLIRRLVKWENSSDENLIAEARYEIARSVARSNGETPPPEADRAAVLRYLNDKALPIYDPFAGGGSIPLEAQRLGLRAVASDLNPVAVLINKALIELPPKFSGKPPINPDADPMGMMTGKFTGRGKNRKPEQIPWRGAAGLANDIRYYGKWMREEAHKRIGHIYPKAKLPDGGDATVIAWLWARTVPCPNPACGVDMPLMTTFQLSKKANNRHWTKPVYDREANAISFHVQNHDDGIDLERTVIRGGKGVVCIACSGTSPHAYIREQSKAGNMGEQMTAIVAEGDRKRLFVSPTEAHIETALSAKPKWRPNGSLPDKALGFRVQGYGFSEWHQLFTERQLIALTTFSDLLRTVRDVVIKQGGEPGYADSICTYLALAVGRDANGRSNFSRWQNGGDKVSAVFSRQAIGMLWDFAESNPFCAATQNWNAQVNWIAQVIERLPNYANYGKVHQADASTTIHAETGPVIVTDPPYYDNIGYADLSDFFYVWLRPLLRDIYPDMFAGILAPKQEEMIAAPRFDDARERFEDLMGKTLKLIRERCSPEFPSSIFYAYKQQEERSKGTSSTGWETMLSALVNTGFQIIGTWPMRTELANRPRSIDSNALASSVVLVCRPRPLDAPVTTRDKFLIELKRELPAALDHLTREGHIAPVDLAQAAIGPGMEVYSKYAHVVKVDGGFVSVRDALIEINHVISEYHSGEQDDLDAASQFCVGWLREYGYAEGEFGRAEVLAQANNVAMEAAPLNGLLSSGGGRAKLLRMNEFAPARPLSGGMTAWEGCMRMAYHLNEEGGQGIAGAATVARDISGVDAVERLARILYDHYNRKNDSANAVIYNALVVSWQDIMTEMQKPRSGMLLDLAE